MDQPRSDAGEIWKKDLDIFLHQRRWIDLTSHQFSQMVGLLTTLIKKIPSKAARTNPKGAILKEEKSDRRRERKKTIKNLETMC